MERINYNGGYLYCSVEVNISEWRNMYNSAEECFVDYKEDIIADCKKNEYNENETNAVLSHYEMIIKNANGEWECKDID